jgi:hypothetical protein
MWIYDSFAYTFTSFIYVYISLLLELFTAKGMNIAVFWNDTPCGTCKSRRSRVIYRLRSSETPVLTRGTLRHISEDCFLPNKDYLQ